ncbi:hypothetical protein [Pseudoalteromonas luteoviolacea]|uniref:hypothetical protein n=1 Tax=Pseudoalteromonas luteoviolacea TaxID=43657 RepID=UPI001B3976A3|nr:hypothetical protein [Pseudoalteromonas luteoviolacea]MBQ4838845.1 hypothetical protein [Pseudoalteromonas luteoviolacea]
MKNTLENITLPSLGFDSFGYSPVAQKNSQSITGRAIIQRGQMLDGRPITLEGARNRSWITRETANQLSELRIKFEPLTLIFNGQTYKVKFDLAQADHLVINHVMGEQLYLEKIKLIEVLN